MISHRRVVKRVAREPLSRIEHYVIEEVLSSGGMRVLIACLSGARLLGSSNGAVGGGGVLLRRWRQGAEQAEGLEEGLLVKSATDAGVIVVAAAGNGSQNLDAIEYDEYRGRGDSGAIIVGAGASSARTRMWFSTYGQRVDVHGWGENVTTAGYGDLANYDGVGNQEYTAVFSGTSSASPMVASAVVALQSHAKSALGRLLTPAEVRQLLIDTGTPQDPAETTHIGPLPNLRAALELLGPAPEPEPEPEPTDPQAKFDARRIGDIGRIFSR